MVDFIEKIVEIVLLLTGFGTFAFIAISKKIEPARKKHALAVQFGFVSLAVAVVNQAKPVVYLGGLMLAGMVCYCAISEASAWERQQMR